MLSGRSVYSLETDKLMTVFTICKVLLQFILHLLHTVMPQPLDAEEVYCSAGARIEINSPWYAGVGQVMNAATSFNPIYYCGGLLTSKAPVLPDCK